MPPRLSVLLLAVGLAALVVLPAAARPTCPVGRGVAAPDRWLAYGGDDQLTNSVEQTMDPGGLTQLWQTTLDGPVFGSPLYLNGVVYAATENGSVYAVDAAGGEVRWRDELGAVQRLDDGCGTWGITSTPTIDPSRNALFAIGGDGLLHGLDLATGAELPS